MAVDPILLINGISALTVTVLDIAEKLNKLAAGEPIEPVSLEELAKIEKKLAALEDLTPKPGG